MPAAVIFDLDGVVVDSESLWDDARRQLVEESGGTWKDEAQQAMMGMSSSEWSDYMRDELDVPMSSEEISEAVVERLEGLYRERLPLLPGARSSIIALAEHWPLALASSSNRPLIQLVLELSGLTDCFEATVSSEEVDQGKPAPDVYLEAAHRLSTEPARCVAVEDSTTGLRSAAAAEMGVVAIPNKEFPPEAEALELADVVLDSIEELGPEVVADLRR